jgi:hypothetical protein
VPTRRGELTRVHPAISALAPRAAGPRPTCRLDVADLFMQRCGRRQISCRSASDPPSSLLPLVNPGVPPSAWALPDRCRARTPAGEVYGEGMKARVATVVGFVARLRCVWSWRLAPVAWRFGPTHACQGMGCRYCGACVPADGWGSCGRALGRGIRPALNPLLNARLSETATRGRAPFAPPRADEDPSWRYGHLQETRRTLT